MISSFVHDLTPVLAVGFFGGWELLIVGGIALLLFGSRLPGAAKSLGQSFSAFKKGLKDAEDSDNDFGRLPPKSGDDEERLS